VSPVKYELGIYIPEDDILHSHCHEDRKSYKVFTGTKMYAKVQWNKLLQLAYAHIFPSF
jgi:hypothetical protein